MALLSVEDEPEHRPYQPAYLRVGTWSSCVEASVSDPIVDVHNLRKTYGEKVAVADVSFAVAHGEIFGVLGPKRLRQVHCRRVHRGAARR